MDRTVLVEVMEQDRLAMRRVQQAGAQAHRATRRNVEDQMRLIATLEHVGHFTAGNAEDLDGLARVFARHIHRRLFNRLEVVAGLILLHQDARTADLEFEALAAHRLHQDGQMQNATACNLKRGGIGNLGDAHRDVRLGLMQQALLQLARAHDIALAANERARGRLEDDSHRGFVNLDGSQAHRMVAARHHIADVSVFHTNNCDDVARGDDFLFLLLQVLEGEHLLDIRVVTRAVVLDDEHGLTLVNGTRRKATNADTADEARMVDRAHLQRDRVVRVDIGSGNLLQNGVEQRIHVHVAVVRLVARIAVHRARVHDGEVELLVGSLELDHQVEHLVDDLLGAAARAVDLVDDHDDAQAQLKRMLEHEARLRHGAFERVDN